MGACVQDAQLAALLASLRLSVGDIKKGLERAARDKERSEAEVGSVHGIWCVRAYRCTCEFAKVEVVGRQGGIMLYVCFAEQGFTPCLAGGTRLLCLN